MGKNIIHRTTYIKKYKLVFLNVPTIILNSITTNSHSGLRPAKKKTTISAHIAVYNVSRCRQTAIQTMNLIYRARQIYIILPAIYMLNTSMWA